MSAEVFIVMTTKNRIALLPRAINSIITQTFKDWELLVIDDNSRDGTQSYLENLVDNRIKVIKNTTGKTHGLVKQEYMLQSDNKYLARQIYQIQRAMQKRFCLEGRV